MNQPIPTTQPGPNGPVVSRTGLGAMGISDLYGDADRTESIAALHAALDVGVTLIDTGDFHGSGHNEMLICEALESHRREDVALSVKFGSRRTLDGGFQPIGYDVSAAADKDRLGYSMRRLGTDYIDIYRPARLNPDIPIEETIGARAEVQQAAYLRHIGLSEVGAPAQRRAAAIAPISDLQIEYSLLSRGPEDTTK